MGERHRHGTWWPTPCPHRDLAEMSDARPDWPVRPAYAMSAGPPTRSPEPAADRVGAPPYRRRRHSTGSAPTGPPPSPVACATVASAMALLLRPPIRRCPEGAGCLWDLDAFEAGRPRTLRSCLVPSSSADSSWVVRGGVGRCRRVPVRRTFTTARCPGAPCPTCRAGPRCEHLVRDLKSRLRRAAVCGGQWSKAADIGTLSGRASQHHVGLPHPPRRGSRQLGPPGRRRHRRQALRRHLRQQGCRCFQRFDAAHHPGDGEGRRHVHPGTRARVRRSPRLLDGRHGRPGDRADRSGPRPQADPHGYRSGGWRGHQGRDPAVPSRHRSGAAHPSGPEAVPLLHPYRQWASGREDVPGPPEGAHPGQGQGDLSRRTALSSRPFTVGGWSGPKTSRSSTSRCSSQTARATGWFRPRTRSTWRGECRTASAERRVGPLPRRRPWRHLPVPRAVRGDGSRVPRAVKGVRAVVVWAEGGASGSWRPLGERLETPVH